MRRLRFAAACTVMLLTAGCSGAGTPSVSSSNGGGSYPVTVTSCDQDLTFDKAPERVLMLTAVGASAMGELGLLDRVVGRAGEIDATIYPEETAQRLGAISIVDSGKTATGGATMSTEAVLEQRADLVIGYDSGVDRKALSEVGVKLYVPQAYCASFSVDRATFALVEEETTRLGSIFGVPEKAREANDALRQRVDGLPAASGGAQSASAYYITVGVDQVTAYGRSSMVQAIFDQVGLANVHQDSPERRIRVGMEAVLDKNPEWIVLLHQEGTPAEVESFFLNQKGVADLTAVTKRQVIVMPFPYTDPPSPLSVVGAVFLSDQITGVQST